MHQASSIKHQASSIKHIVLASNYDFRDHLLTTIKSICYYNKNIQFYLLNKDFPAEWFHQLNLRLEKLNCHIIDMKVFNQDVSNYYTYTGSEATYFRYFIPKLISEDKLLYLDCDLIVTGSLNGLYIQDFDNNFIIAVRDTLSCYKTNKDDFNAGVMLINNKLWREEYVTENALRISNEKLDDFPDGDQSVLNYLFNGRWKEVFCYYNYLTGTNIEFISIGRPDLVQDLHNVVPLIVHYNTYNKPWKNNNVEYSNLYWKYRNLDWSEIYLHQGISI